MRLTSETYKILKWAALIALPSIGTFYNIMSGIWGLPHGHEVLQTCSEVGILIGVLIGISQHTIAAGQNNVTSVQIPQADGAAVAPVTHSDSEAVPGSLDEDGGGDF